MLETFKFKKYFKISNNEKYNFAKETQNKNFLYGRLKKLSSCY